jgi:long-chain acyl-CoA synthetase
MSKEIFRKYTDQETFDKIVTFSTVGEMWARSVSTAPDAVAITDAGREYTYRELDSLVAIRRGSLAAAGVAKGKPIAILMPNCADFAIAFLAAATLGAPSVLMPAHLPAETVFGISAGYGIGAIVYSEALADKVALVRQRLPHVALIAASDYSAAAADAASVGGSDLCTVIFTGGTTGKSKGARLSHAAVMAGVRNGCYGIKSVFGERYLLVLPLTHVFGLIRNLLTSLYTFSNLFICRNNKDMFRDIAVFRPTIMVMVPALAEMALGLSRQFGRNMLGADMKTVICGAAAVAPYLVTEYDKLGISLLPGYGLTESANLVSGNPEALRKPESVGLIYPDMEYTVVDGELWLKGLNMMDGYMGGEENATAYEDGWFKTGDLVRIDDEGFLYITGRTKEIIVLPSGENVSPAELETYFYAVDTVQDCLVYEDEGGTLTVEILPRAAQLAAAGITDAAAHFKAECDRINASLPHYERINKVVVRDTDFVRTPAMKIARNLNGNVKK